MVNDVKKPMGRFPNVYEPQLYFNPLRQVKNFISGVGIAISSLFRNITSNPEISSYFFNFFAKQYLPVILVMYALVIGLCTLSLPLTLVVMIAAPGWLWQILLLVPYWSLSIAMKRAPTEIEVIFLTRVRQLNEVVANDLYQKRQAMIPQSWYRAVIDTVRKSSFLLISSVLISLLHLIPLYGSILAALVQWYLVSSHLTLQLLEVYTTGCEGMTWREKQRFLKQNRFLFLGFGFPYSLLMSIPLIGPLCVVFAVASAADLYYDAILPKYTDHINEPIPNLKKKMTSYG